MQSRLQRKTSTPWLYDLQVATGPNEFLAGLEPNANFISVPRLGTVSDDIAQLVASWSASPSSNRRFDVWKATESDGKPNLNGQKLVGQFPAIAELYGYQRLLDSYASTNQAPALVLAEKYHLVSPVSSAVVHDETPKAILAPAADVAAEKNPLSLLAAANKVDAGKSSSTPDQFGQAFDTVSKKLNSLSSAVSSQGAVPSAGIEFPAQDEKSFR